VLPAFDEATGLLPPGEHEATWNEVERALGFMPNRKLKLRRLGLALANLRDAGCRRVLLDGSFATAEPHPNDFDAAWDPQGADVSKLNPAFLDFGNQRARQKALWGGEFFISTGPAAPGGITFSEFFQLTRDGHQKGVIVIDPRTVP
jgi:hypothetical protein